MRPELIPSEAEIFAWIEEVVGHGVRRPGYPADRWAEDWLRDRFAAFGLERVRAEPVETPYWEPGKASLVATSAEGSEASFDCFGLPFCAPVAVDGPLVEFDLEQPTAVRGAVALCEFSLLRVPHGYYKHVGTWCHDPDGSFDDASHLLPFTRSMQDVMEPAVEAGAIGFVGVVGDYPGGGRDYYVPYDAKQRPIPAVWIAADDARLLRDWLVDRRVDVRLQVDATRSMITSWNIVGELPGADDETVIVGSHHDGPWSSAVEDGSGIALVLAQAAYWSRVPARERPHRLLFLLSAGHMAGGAGQRTFVQSHAPELARVVLELHLEHAANEVVEDDGAVRSTGRPEARWWFTSRIARLESAVRDAIEAEDLRRSYILPPNVFGEKPTTDAADFFPAGVPIVNYLVAPFYLFDAMDTLDMIHRPSLVPVTRAAVRIIESTAVVSADEMRAGIRNS